MASAGDYGSAEVHHYENYYDNEIFNMFTQKEHYTEILEDTSELHFMQHDNSNVILVDSSMALGGGELEQHTTIVKETRAYFESLYNNLVIEIEKVNTVNPKMREKNADLTTELARYKGQEKYKHDPPAMYDSEETLQLAQESRLKMKQLNKEIEPVNYAKINKLSEVFVSQKVKSLEKKFLNEVKDTIVTFQRVIKSRMSLNVNNWSSIVHQEVHNILKDEIAPIINQVDARVMIFEKLFLKEVTKFVRDFKSLTNEADESFDMNKVLEYENERLLKAVVNQDIMSIVQNHSVVDTLNLQTELDHTKEKLETCIIKKEKEYAVLWNNWYKKSQLGELKGQSLNTPCASDTLDPLSQKLDDENMSLEINTLQNSRVEKVVPNKPVKPSVKTKPITVSQPHVMTKKDVNSDSNGLSSAGVESTAKTRRPQPMSNIKNDRVPSASKSSCLKNN
ncbi:hypothetical protein Tco_0179344 [Tanacetum coccineum]